MHGLCTEGRQPLRVRSCLFLFFPYSSSCSLIYKRSPGPNLKIRGAMTNSPTPKAPPRHYYHAICWGLVFISSELTNIQLSEVSNLLIQIHHSDKRNLTLRKTVPPLLILHLPIALPYFQNTVRKCHNLDIEKTTLEASESLGHCIHRRCSQLYLGTELFDTSSYY